MGKNNAWRVAQIEWENANSEVAGTTAQPQPAPAQTPGEPKRKKHHNKNPKPSRLEPGSSN